MKSLLTTALFFLTLSFGINALATCDGIPIKEDDKDVSCGFLKDKQSCQRVLGCKWTPKVALIRICNKTDKKISIATQQIRTNYDIIAEAGWWNLDVGQCNDFEAPNANSFSYFAKSYNGYFYWYGNGQHMCYDPSGNRFDNARKISENSCGSFTEIRAFQTLPVKEDDFFQLKIEGPGVDLSPAPEEPTFLAMAVAVCTANGEFSVTSRPTSEQAKASVLKSCQVNCNGCELALLMDPDRAACLAVLAGSGNFRAFASSYDGKEAAINSALKHCQEKGQTCKVDYTACNNEMLN